MIKVSALSFFQDLFIKIMYYNHYNNMLSLKEDFYYMLNSQDIIIFFKKHE